MSAEARLPERDATAARVTATLVPVVAAVVRSGTRYLLGKRPRSKRHGGLWEFPGGKVHEGESRLEAARRELAEELDLEVLSLGDLIVSIRDGDAPFVIEFHETCVRGAPTPREHQGIGWFTLDDLVELPLAPADARFVAHVREGSR